MLIRVLVVEDDEGDSFLIQELLTELREQAEIFGLARFQPVAVATLPEALLELRSGQYEVAILDLEIGGASGTEALAAALAEAPEVPIVAITSRDDVELGIRAVESGAQDHLVKGELVGNRLARSVLYAIERQRQCASLRARTIVDELTGLCNRRGFYTLGEQTLKLARRKGRDLVVVFIDLDGLKRVNDTYGHEQGDALIRDAAGLLRATFRDSDIVARLGGDEFAVVANETGDTSAATITGRLEAAIEVRNLLLPAERRLSMSIGAVRHNVAADADLAELLAQADSEMYANKRQRTTAGRE
jgi:two-component system cell cycle response regulator